MLAYSRRPADMVFSGRGYLPPVAERTWEVCRRQLGLAGHINRSSAGFLTLDEGCLVRPPSRSLSTRLNLIHTSLDAPPHELPNSEIHARSAALGAAKK